MKIVELNGQTPDGFDSTSGKRFIAQNLAADKFDEERIYKSLAAEGGNYGENVFVTITDEQAEELLKYGFPENKISVK
jgi:hypothetical protein